MRRQFVKHQIERVFLERVEVGPGNLAQRTNDHGQENTNGNLSKPQLRWSSHGSSQRQKDQDDSERRDVPYKGAQQKNPAAYNAR